MTVNELKKLSRTDLLEMLLDQSKKVEELENKLQEAEDALRNREIVIDHAGSIAEAALQWNGIFEAAQGACAQYIENIQQLKERQENVCIQLEADSRAEAERLTSEAKRESERLLSETKIQCAEMIAKAKAETQSYWTDVSGKLESFYQEHAGLREILSVVPRDGKQGSEE